MDSSSIYPWEIRELEPEQTDELLKYFENGQTGFIRVGPKGYFLPATCKKEALNIYNMPVRPSDIFVAGYPRSGSTWIRELIWIIANDWNYSEASTVPLQGRFLFLDIYIPIDRVIKDKLLKETDEEIKFINTITQPKTRTLEQMQSPRFVHTHLPLSLLPPPLLDTAKVVYVARDPRDVVVSFYHFNKLHRLFGYNGDFKTFWNFFISNKIYWTPYFDSLKEWWEKRHHPNMLFLHYEEMSKDLPSVIRRVASFLDKTCSEGQLTRLTQHLNIDSFRNNKSVNLDILDGFGLLVQGEQPFIRKGKVNGWHDYFDEEMTQQAEEWIAHNLRDTDLRYPLKKP